MLEGRGHRYDPMVIDLLEPMLSLDEKNEIDEIKVNAAQLQQGMLLARDLMHPDGFLLLSKHKVLVRHLIEQLVTVEKDLGRSLEIYIEYSRYK